MFKEFKEFIMTGNVMDFAIAVILAAAVGLVVNGFVDDIVMPVVGEFMGGVDFAERQYELSPAEIGEDGAVIKEANAIRYGKWLNTIINLLVVGWVLFMMAKSKNRFMKSEDAPDPGPTLDQTLLTEIRDALKK